jgi:hypothetical protein
VQRRTPLDAHVGNPALGRRDWPRQEFGGAPALPRCRRIGCLRQMRRGPTAETLKAAERRRPKGWMEPRRPRAAASNRRPASCSLRTSSSEEPAPLRLRKLGCGQPPAASAWADSVDLRRPGSGRPAAAVPAVASAGLRRLAFGRPLAVVPAVPASVALQTPVFDQPQAEVWAAPEPGEPRRPAFGSRPLAPLAEVADLQTPVSYSRWAEARRMGSPPTGSPRWASGAGAAEAANRPSRKTESG